MADVRSELIAQLSDVPEDRIVWWSRPFTEYHQLDYGDLAPVVPWRADIISIAMFRDAHDQPVSYPIIEGFVEFLTLTRDAGDARPSPEVLGALSPAVPEGLTGLFDDQWLNSAVSRQFGEVDHLVLVLDVYVDFGRPGHRLALTALAEVAHRMLLWPTGLMVIPLHLPPHPGFAQDDSNLPTVQRRGARCMRYWRRGGFAPISRHPQFLAARRHDIRFEEARNRFDRPYPTGRAGRYSALRGLNGLSFLRRTADDNWVHPQWPSRPEHYITKVKTLPSDGFRTCAPSK